MTSNPLVFIIDDDHGVRDSLNMLMISAGLKAKTYPSANVFLENFDDSHTGCIITDIRMPGLSGIELHQKLIEQNITLPVIFITGHGDVKMAVDAMKAGALDFLEKPIDNHILLERVKRCINLSQSDSPFNPSLTTNNAKLLNKLTSRERQVMELLVKGKMNKTIAAELNISVRTIEAHRAKIMKKLDARSLSDIVKIALSQPLH